MIMSDSSESEETEAQVRTIAGRIREEREKNKAKKMIIELISKYM